MREEPKPYAGRSSKGEIAAAWACCGVVIIGALLGEVVLNNANSAPTVHAGARIPGGGGQRLHGPEPDDDPYSQRVVSAIGASSNPEALVNGAASSIASRTKPAGWHCPFVLRLSNLAYSRG